MLTAHPDSTAVLEGNVFPQPEWLPALIAQASIRYLPSADNPKATNACDPAHL